MKIKRLLNDSKAYLTSYLSQGGKLAYSFLLIALFTQCQSTESYGIYVFTLSIVSLLSDVLGQSSIDSSLYLIRTRNSSLYLTLQNALKWDGLTAGVLMVAAFITNYSVDLFLNASYHWAPVIVAVKIAFVNFRNFVFIDFINANRYNKVYTCRFVEQCLLLCAVPMLFIYFEYSLVSLLLIEALVASIVTVGVVGHYAFKRHHILKNTQCKGEFAFKLFLNHASKLFVTRSIKVGTKKLDNVLVGLYISSEALGTYDMLKKLVLPLDLVINPFREIFYPTVLLHKASSNLSELISTIRKQNHRIILFLLCYYVFVAFTYSYWFEFTGITSNSRTLVLLMALLANFSGSALLWWARSFSNAWNPYYSMIANLIVLLVLVLSSIYMGVHQEYALAGALIVNALFSLTFWYTLLLRQR